MKNFYNKVERASKMEDLKTMNRKQRRFLAAVTQKIVDKEIALTGLQPGNDNPSNEKEN